MKLISKIHIRLRQLNTFNGLLLMLFFLNCITPFENNVLVVLHLNLDVALSMIINCTFFVSFKQMHQNNLHKTNRYCKFQ